MRGCIRGRGRLRRILRWGMLTCWTTGMPMRQECFGGRMRAGRRWMIMRTIWGRRRRCREGMGRMRMRCSIILRSRHPDSIFKANAPVLLANAYLQQNDPQGALRVLVAAGGYAAGIACGLSLCAGTGLPDVGGHVACGGGLSELVRQSALEYGGGAGARRRCRR